MANDITATTVAFDLSGVLDAIPDGVYAVDGAGRVVLVNAAACELLGYAPEQLIGRSPHDLVHHTRRDGTPYPAAECPLARATSEGRVYRSDDDLFWRQDGSSFPVEYQSHPIQQAGAAMTALVTFRDITARRQHEERLRELLREQFTRARVEFQHAQLRDVLAQTPAIIAVTRGPRHVIEMVNERYRALYDDREVVGMSIREAFPDASYAQLALMDRAYETGMPATLTELPVEVRSGTAVETRFFNYTYQPLRAESGAIYGLMTHATDVTREVQARRAVEIQNKRALLTAAIGVSMTRQQPVSAMLHESVDAVVDFMDAALARIWTLDGDGRVLELQASAGLYSHSDDTHDRVALGHSMIGRIAAERRAHVSEDVSSPELGDPAFAKAHGLRTFAGYPLMVGDDLFGVLALFTRHRLDDNDLQALATAAQGVAVGIQRSHSERALLRRADELTGLATKLERTNRDLDAFAYAASHDLRAPLRGISNLAQWIEEDLGAQGSLKSETREMLELMRTRMHRMESLIEGILRYSRAGRTDERVETVDTGRLVREVVELLDVPEHVALTIATDMPTIESAALPLQQVFMNLVANAIKYNKSPEPRVEIGWRPDGDFLEFSVTDNGPGIADEYHERIWGIFQTLEARDKVEGTGIGLSLVKKLVEQHGGHAWVDSTPGAGATFRFLWPRRPTAAQQTGV